MRNLTDRQLLSQLNGIARRERAATLALLLTLGEVEHRRLHLSMGHSTVFDFLVRRLGYSESGAARRLRVARCFRSYPELVPMFRRRDVSSSTLMAVSGVLDPSNRATLIPAIKGKTRREVDTVVARLKAPIRVADSIRPAMVRTGRHCQRDRALAPTSQVAEATTSAERPIVPPARAGEPAGSVDAADPADPAAHDAASREMRIVRFAATPGFEAKLAKVRSLHSSRSPNGAGLAEVIDAALEAYLETHDPARRQRRREKRRAAAERRAAGAAGSSVRAPSPPVGDGAIPAAVRDEIFVRDGGRCTYRGPDGTRCRSRRNLQIDHTWPRALGGSSAPENLRVLCANHNRHAAEGMFPGRLVRARGPGHADR